MNKILLVLSAAALCVAVCFFLQNQDSTQKTPQTIGMPSSEEDREVRKKWERMMLADPATGQIPAGIRFKERWFAQELAARYASDRGGVDWQPRGPFNVGGRTRALAIDVTDEKRLLAGGVSGGVWLSEDGGQSWSRRTPAGAHPGCVSIAQDTRPGFTNIWYYLSGEIIGTSASGGGAFYLGDGMFKSTDGGKTWTVLGNTDNGNPQTFSDLWQSGWRVVVHPQTGHVYAATYSSIFRSTDGGTNWTSVLGGISTSPFSSYTDLLITPSGVLYATFSSEGARKGLWRSTNGTNWTNITSTDFPKTFDRTVIGLNPDNENEVYFLAETPNFGFSSFYISSTNWSSLWKYTYVSGDGSGAGGTWTDLSQNLPNTGTEFDRFANQGGYDLCVRVQPGTGHVFIGGTNLWRSTDGFTSPNNTTKIGGYKIGTTLPFFEIYPNHHPDQHDMLFLPSNPNVMLSASDGGLHRTEDCLAPFVEWSSLNRGYQTTQFYTAIFEKAQAGDPELIGGLQDNGNFFTNSTSPTSTWVQTVNGDGAFGAIPDGRPYHILSIQQGRLVKCAINNAGQVTAFQRFDPIGRTKEDYLFINPLALDPSNQNKLYLPAGNQFYRQDDLNAIPLAGEWDSISAGWTKFPDTLTGSGHVFSAIGISKAAPAHRVYLGTSRNRIFRIDNADTGAPAMTELDSPLDDAPAGETQPYVSCIAVDPADANKVVLVFSNYNIYSIWASEDGGATWRKVGGNLEQTLAGTGSSPSVRWISILAHPNGTRQYFAGTSVGLYSAPELKLHSAGNAGTVWTPEGAATIGAVPVMFIDTRSSDGLVVAATHGHGMWSANFSAPIASHEPDFQPVVKISPNPAGNFAEVAIPENAGQIVRLRVFDAGGKLVREKSWSGERQRIDLQGLPTGNYLFNLEGKGWRKTVTVAKM